MRLKVGRMGVYLGGFVAAILVPVIAAFAVGDFGPSPYLLDEGRLGPEWTSPRWFPDGSTVFVQTYPSPAAANRAADSISGSIPTSSRSRTLNVVRYTRADDRRRGLLLPVGRRTVRIEAADDRVVDDRLRSLPFIRENPEKNLLWVLITQHGGAAAFGLGLYIVALGYFMVRGASWAAEIAPPPGVAPVRAETLRSRILALNDLDLPFHVREEPNGRLVAEWRIADARWVGLLESGGLREAHRIYLELDPGAHRVRSLDVQKTVSWSGGVGHLSGRFSFFRGISFFDYRRGMEAGVFLRKGRWKTQSYSYRFVLSEMKAPLVEAILDSGWKFTPVASFLLRPLAR